MSLVRVHNVRVESAADTTILAIGAANTAIPRQWYFGETTNSFYFGKLDGSLSAPIPGTPYISAIGNTNTVNLTNSTGTLTANVNISATANNNLIDDTGLFVKKLTVHAGSTAYMEVDSNYQLKVKQLLVTDNTVDSTNSTLSAHLTAVGYNSGNLIYQESDMIILTLSHQTWIQNGGTAGTTADFTAISADVTDSYIRNLFSGVSGVDYNVGTGVFSLNQSFTRGLFSGTGLITYTSGTGVITLADSTVRGLFSGTSPINYVAGTGVISLNANGITDSYLRQGAALSIIGRQYNTSGNVADIVAGTDGHILRRAGTEVTFGLINPESMSITNKRIPFGNASNVLTSSSLFSFDYTVGNQSRLQVSGSFAQFEAGIGNPYIGSANAPSFVGASYLNSGTPASNLFGVKSGGSVGAMTDWAGSASEPIVGMAGYVNLSSAPRDVGAIYISGDGTTAGTSYSGRITFVTSNGAGSVSEKMRLTKDGYLWIGTTSGAAVPLDVNGVINAATGYRIANTATSGQYLRGNGTNFVSSALLASDLSGTVGVVNGGTGAATLTANKVLVGNGTSAILSPTNLHWDNTNSRLGIGTASPAVSLDVNGVINAVTGFRLNAAATTGQYLRGNGTNFVSSALLASDLSGAVPVANGGTGLTALGSSLQYLRTNTAGTAMEWATLTPPTYTFNNGLTLSSTTVKFGGTALDQHTTLPLGNFNLFFTRGTGKVTFFDTTAGPSGFNIYNNDLELQPANPASALTGVIWYSPNGTRWRVTMSNEGALTSTSL